MKRKVYFWVFILVVVAAVLAVVFINLFKTPSTQKLALSLNSYIERGYLSTDDYQEKNDCEYKDIQKYLLEVEQVLTTSQQRNEVKNVRYAYQAYVVQANFFNRQLPFTVFKDEYKKNKKKIENLLSECQNLADKAEEYIVQHRDLTSGSDYWKAETWAGVRDDLVALTTKTAEALTLLTEVYEACVNSQFMNNGLTEIVFDASNEFSEELIAGLDQDATIAQRMSSFTNVYYTASGEELILDYCYKSNYQLTVSNIKNSWKSDTVLFNRFLAGNLG